MPLNSNPVEKTDNKKLTASTYGNYKVEGSESSTVEVVRTIASKRRIVSIKPKKSIRHIFKYAPDAAGALASASTIGTIVAEKDFIIPILVFCIANLGTFASRKSRFGKAGDVIARGSYLAIQCAAADAAYNILREAIGSKDGKQALIAVIIGLAFTVGAANEAMHIKEEIKNKVNVHLRDNRVRAAFTTAAICASTAVTFMLIKEVFRGIQKGELDVQQAAIYIALTYSALTTLKQNIKNRTELVVRVKEKQPTL